MPYEATYDPENDFVLVRFEGEVDWETTEQCTAEVMRLASAHKCYRVLSDLRSVTSGLSIVDIYNIPKLVSGAGFPLTGRRAVIAGPDSPDYDFFETVLMNSGQNVRIFSEPDEATRWLMEQP